MYIRRDIYEFLFAKLEIRSTAEQRGILYIYSICISTFRFMILNLPLVPAKTQSDICLFTSHSRTHSVHIPNTYFSRISHPHEAHTADRTFHFSAHILPNVISIHLAPGESFFFPALSLFANVLCVKLVCSFRLLRFDLIC